MDYLVYCIIFFLGLCHGAYAQEDYKQALGSGAFLPNVDTLDNLPSSRNIFSSDVTQYIIKSTYAVVKDFNRFSKETKEVYDELAQNAGISGSYASLSFSLDQTFKVISKSSSEITSAYVNVYSFGYKAELQKDTISNVALHPELLTDLLALPQPIENPHESSSWLHYEDFLKKWGSHYVTTVYTGSWLQQWSVAQSSRKYSQTDFTARACLKFGAKKVEIDACAGISTSQMDSASSFEMSDTLFVKGGTPETRSQITTERTPDLLAKFKLEGSSSEVPVQYKFATLWDLIRERFVVGSKEWQIATNLEAYYLGYLAFDCKYRESAGEIIQKFVAKSGPYSTTFYQCLRSCRGCHRDADCHIGGAGSVCYCYGDTCIEKDATNHPRIRRYQSGSYYEAENLSCRYQVGVWCACRRSDYFDEEGCTDAHVVNWTQEDIVKMLISTNTTGSSDVTPSF